MRSLLSGPVTGTASSAKANPAGITGGGGRTVVEHFQGQRRKLRAKIDTVAIDLRMPRYASN